MEYSIEFLVLFHRSLLIILCIVVQLLSHVQHFVNLWTTTHQGSLSITISWRLLKLMSIELVMPSNHLILCCPLLLLSIFPSIRVFSNESDLHIRWPKYWSFSFSISPCNEYSGLISFSIHRFDLFAVQGTLKSFVQITVQKHQFFGTKLSFWSKFHIHTWWTGKTIVLTRQTLVGKVISAF